MGKVVEILEDAKSGIFSGNSNLTISSNLCEYFRQAQTYYLNSFNQSEGAVIPERHMDSLRVAAGLGLGRILHLVLFLLHLLLLRSSGSLV